MTTQRVTMRNDERLMRDHLLYALKGDGAHLDFEAAVKDVDPVQRGKKPRGAQHTPWQLLEHLRICQWDVLEFIRSPKHVSPEFPAGYWPKSDAPPSAAAWEKSADAFRADFAALVKMIEDESCDVFGDLHGVKDQTVARKILMIADHTSYHLGELVLLRRMLGDWQE